MYYLKCSQNKEIMFIMNYYGPVFMVIMVIKCYGPVCTCKLLFTSHASGDMSPPLLRMLPTHLPLISHSMCSIYDRVCGRQCQGSQPWRNITEGCILLHMRVITVIYSVFEHWVANWDHILLLYIRDYHTECIIRPLESFIKEHYEQFVGWPWSVTSII